MQSCPYACALHFFSALFLVWLLQFNGLCAAAEISVFFASNITTKRSRFYGLFTTCKKDLLYGLFTTKVDLFLWSLIR